MANNMIEIEKKFLLTAAQKSDLLDGAHELGHRLVEDSYFDTDDFALSTGDFWLRERDGVYELKAPLKSGDGSSSGGNHYHEITDTDEIAHELGLAAGQDFATELSLAGIKKFVTCFTSRESYEKQGFHVDIDSATYLDSVFVYALAEIELLVRSESEANEADKRIIEFARGFGLTTDQVILGKIGAFIKSERPEHYKALVDAGVFK